MLRCKNTERERKEQRRERHGTQAQSRRFETLVKLQGLGKKRVRYLERLLLHGCQLSMPNKYWVDRKGNMPQCRLFCRLQDTIFA